MDIKFEDYVLWKKKKIFELIENKKYKFEYSYLKNKEELNKYFNNNITDDELQNFEIKLESLEDEIYFNKNETLVSFDEYLEKIKQESIDDFNKISKRLQNFFEGSNEFRDLKINNSIIKELLFDEKIKKDYKNFVDIYGISIDENLIIDKEKKEIWRNNEKNII